MAKSTSKSSKSKAEREESRNRKLASAELRGRAGRNMIFGAVAAIVGGILTMWSRSTGAEIGLSITELISWGLMGYGAVAVAIGLFQVYQAREVLDGRMKIPASILPEVRPARPAVTVPLDLSLHRSYRSNMIGLIVFGALTVIGIAFEGPVHLLLAVFGAAALYNAARLVMTWRRTPQTIHVGEDGLRLPRHLFRRAGDDGELVDPVQVTHIYFLRRSGPRFTTPPVLVVEVGDEAILYPRDWFQSDDDQERVAAAMRARVKEAHAS